MLNDAVDIIIGSDYYQNKTHFYQCQDPEKWADLCCHT